MVLESLSNAYDAEMHPGKIFIHGMIYSAVAAALALWTFPQYASITTILLTSLASMPLIYNIIRYEEDKDTHNSSEWFLLNEHKKAIKAYFMLFLGIITTLTLASFILQGTAYNQLFEAQIDTYNNINPHKQITGAVTENVPFFNRILANNIRVLVLSTLFSFIYGAGAIFILSWNASVIALAIGNTIQTHLPEGTVSLLNAVGISVHTVFIRYGIHGTIEILAYMIAALAGGIISVAVIKHHYTSEKFENILVDAADLILIAFALILLGAGWEAFITPILKL